jgi:hypothetical protein
MIGSRHPFRVTCPLAARLVASAGLGLLLAACAARQSAETIAHAPETPGFWLGLWHGFIFPVAGIVSLFVPDVAVYAVPNNGGWYDFGFFIGIVFLGVGSHKTNTVTRTIYVDRRGG